MVSRNVVIDRASFAVGKDDHNKYEGGHLVKRKERDEPLQRDLIWNNRIRECVCGESITRACLICLLPC